METTENTISQNTIYTADGREISLDEYFKMMQLERVSLMRKKIFYNSKFEAVDADYKEFDEPWAGLNAVINHEEENGLGRHFRSIWDRIKNLFTPATARGARICSAVVRS